MIFHYKPSSYWVPPRLWKPPTGMNKIEKPIEVEHLPPNLSGDSRGWPTFERSWAALKKKRENYLYFTQR